MSDDLPSRLANCFTAVFPDLDPAAVPGATRLSVENWDSLASFSLLTVIEEEFGVQVAPDDVDRFTSYASILDYLREHVPSGA